MQGACKPDCAQVSLNFGEKMAPSRALLRVVCCAIVARPTWAPIKGFRGDGPDPERWREEALHPPVHGGTICTQKPAGLVACGLNDTWPWASTPSLALHERYLSGTIPTEIGRLSFNLAGGLYLHGNRISGTIPTEIGMLSKLSAYVMLDYNSLSGTIPTELSRLSHLMGGIFLRNNRLSGRVPVELAVLSQGWDAAGQPDADLQKAVSSKRARRASPAPKGGDESQSGKSEL